MRQETIFEKKEIFSMKTEKRQLRIGELAQELEVKKFVIRFWEKEFGIKAPRTEGQQRLYSEKDVEFFKTVKSLLYQQGFTISGAKKQLELQRSGHITPSEKTTLEEQISPEESVNNPASSVQLAERMAHIHKQLIKLRELLQ